MGMDIPRESGVRNRRIRRTLYGIGLAAVLALVTVGVARLEPAMPSVDRSLVWVDTVKRGPMLRQVRGAGTLVPESILWIPAATEGRVERKLALPGISVTPDTVLLEMSNPELELAAVDARSSYQGAEADYNSLQVSLESELLTLQSAVAFIEAEHRQAVLRFRADEDLAQDGLVAELDLELSRVRANDLEKRAELERRRLEISAESTRAQLAAQRARVEQMKAAADLRRKQVEQLTVRAGNHGVLQELPVEVGQQVTMGTNLAKVTEPTKLKAEVRIAETQARDVAVGQVASIDTRNGVISGRVTRIDPAVQNGTVLVDVALEGPLPRGARPDLSVDGTIELERLTDVLYVGRPAFGQAEGTIGLFKLIEDGGVGVRTQVRLGRSSVSTIEIVGGLSENDEVILSDMSNWDDFDKVRIN